MVQAKANTWSDLVASLEGKEGAQFEEALDDAVESFLGELTDDEKLHCLSGDVPVLTGGIKMIRTYNIDPLPAGVVERLGIPGVWFADGPRGCVVGHSTAFPVSMARGATFDPELEETVADTIGKEIRAQGGNLFAGICINLLRHPAWGRAQETYGEDSFLLAKMGVAAVEGVQQHVMGCIKHYALNSIENSRFKVDVTADRADLDDIYLSHFKACIDAGAVSVMSSYNKVNGKRASANRELLTSILRDEWGFDGFVMSDFTFGVRNAGAAVAAGNDLEMPMKLLSYGLKRALGKGRLNWDDVNRSAGRILKAQLRFSHVGDESYPQALVASKPHTELARTVAQRSMVLLKNEPSPTSGAPVLPLNASEKLKVAVIGKLAVLKNTGDKGSSDVRPPYVTTFGEGLSARANEDVTVDVTGSDDQAAAVAAAKGSDVAVIVVGYTHKDEGEYVVAYGGDREDLTLRETHEQLIEAVTRENPNTVVVLVGGSAIICERWIDSVAAVLMAWYPGMEGGNALADVLFGDSNPSGRLPSTWPRSKSQLPPFDPKAKAVTYGPLHGYRLMASNGHDPAFWFGAGESYTSFEWSDGQIDVGSKSISVAVTNSGDRLGREVVQVYGDVALGSSEQELGSLCGFKSVEIEPGATELVTVDIDESLWNRVAEGTGRLNVGRSSDPTAYEFTLNLA